MGGSVLLASSFQLKVKTPCVRPSLRFLALSGGISFQFTLTVNKTQRQRAEARHSRPSGPRPTRSCTRSEIRCRRRRRRAKRLTAWRHLHDFSCRNLSSNSKWSHRNAPTRTESAERRRWSVAGAHTHARTHIHKSTVRREKQSASAKLFI